MAAAMTVAFDFDKATKNTYRFTEVADDGADVIGTLYVKKSALGAEAPAKLEVSIKVV